jgi:uncharacterized protein
MTSVPSDTRWRIKVGSEETTALFEPAPDSTQRTVFVCAHGAGGHMGDRGVVALAQQFRDRSIDVVRFNFLYREKGAGRPDTMDRLKECVAAVASHARTELQPRTLIIGGRSMGGRAASMLAADGFACDGVLLLAYPLHPAGKPDKLRDTHLAHIKVPVLCLNGTRDALCTRELMEQAVSDLRERWTMQWLEGADHSFHVLKASGRSDSDVLAEIGAASESWVSRLGR